MNDIIRIICVTLQISREQDRNLALFFCCLDRLRAYLSYLKKVKEEKML